MSGVASDTDVGVLLALAKNSPSFAHKLGNGANSTTIIVAPKSY